MLTRYWIEFVPSERYDDDEASPLPRTCGVTAASLDDALALVRALVFRGAALPPVQRVTEGVDTGMLTMVHVGPYSLPPDAAGVWYPPVGVAGSR